MDKTTELKARLRSAYLRHREDLNDLETVVACEVVASGTADHHAADVLDALVYDEEIALLCKSLKLPKIVEVLGPDEYRPGKEWIVERPNGHSFKHSARSEFTLLTILVSVVEEWIDHLDEDAPDLDGLTPDARVVLAAMRDLGAFCVDARITHEKIRERVADLGDKIGGGRFDRAVAIVKARGYIDSKSGTATWLTPRGQKAADMVKAPSKSK